MRTLQEMRGMGKYGVETFLACKPEAMIGQHAAKQGMEVYHIPFRSNTDLRSVIDLYKVIRKLKIDILNCHSSIDMWVGGLAAKLAGIKLIRSQHHPKKPGRFRSHLMYKLSDHVIPTGDNVRKQLINDYGLEKERVTSIPSGQDQDRFSVNRYDRDQERARLNLKDGDVAIGTLAFISRRKGIYEFLPAAKALNDKYPNFKFFLAGGGRDLPKAEKFIEENGLQNSTRLLGHLEDPAPYLAALDIFVMASHEESGPQTLIQAMLMGLPTIATRNVGSVPDLYEDNMLQFNAKDSEGLRACIEELAGDQQLRQKLAANARKPAITQFSEEVMFKRLLAVYNNLLPKN